MKAITQASPSAPELGNRVQIRLKGHRWNLSPLVAKIIRPCGQCQEGVDARYRCLHQRASVCTECQKSLPDEGRDCVQCLAEGISSDQLEVRDALMRNLQGLGELQCAECHWSGSLKDLDAHIGVCANKGEPSHSLLPSPQHLNQEMIDTAVTRRLQDAQWLSRLLSHTLPPTEDAKRTCKWGCDVSLTERQLEVHYAHCPAMLVDCSACKEQHARRDFAAHTRLCKQRIVACPAGCGTPGLGVWEVEGGDHQKVCPKVDVSCPDCMETVKPFELVDHRKNHILTGAGSGLIQCRFCLKNIHGALGVAHSKICSADGAHFFPIDAHQQATLHVQAIGPVYVTQLTGFDPVYVRLPVCLLQDETEAGACVMDCMTSGVCFRWADMNCGLDMKYNSDSQCFDVRVCYSQPPVAGRSTEAKLYDQKGCVLEELGEDETVLDNGGKRLTTLGQDFTLFSIKALDSILSSQSEFLFLQFGPVSEPVKKAESALHSEMEVEMEMEQ